MAGARPPLSSAPASPPPAPRAAECVRVLTEHQQCSTRNRAKTVRQYAEHRGIAIIKTHADDARSGLVIGGRAALQQMMAGVESGAADGNVIRVCDVTRRGRIEAADESAWYECRCRRGGMQAEYCAEHLENDGSATSTIVKRVKCATA